METSLEPWAKETTHAVRTMRGRKERSAWYTRLSSSGPDLLPSPVLVPAAEPALATEPASGLLGNDWLWWMAPVPPPPPLPLPPLPPLLLVLPSPPFLGPRERATEEDEAAMAGRLRLWLRIAASDLGLASPPGPVGEGSAPVSSDTGTKVKAASSISPLSSSRGPAAARLPTSGLMACRWR